MDIRFQVSGSSPWKADVVLSFVFEDNCGEDSCPELAARAPWLGIAPAWRDFRAHKDESVMFYGPKAMEISRVLCVGLGSAEKADITAFRYAVGAALRRCRDYDMETVGIDCCSLARAAARLGVTMAALVREAVLCAFLGLYRYDRWLSEKSPHADPRWLALLIEGEFVENNVRAAAQLGEAEAAGIMLARDAANDPANIMTPSAFANKAKAVAARHGMTFRVLGREQLEAEGMNAYLAVARGSSEDPRMVVMEYTPKGTEGLAPLILVGKGLCFDSGGISLKPAKGMEDMKGDMSGAAAVLGVLEALGQLRSSANISHPVVGIMACAENMPDGRAAHPGDIVVAKNGKSIEIVNTDAEGRLVLADALAWAQEHYQPFRIIDIATLTGACAVALGLGAAGVFSNNEAFAAELCAAGNALGERSWVLPLWTSASLEVLKSPCADMINSGIREGGAIHAAVFLQQFIRKGAAWAHIDMAAADNGESPINAKGATGFGVRTLISAVLSGAHMLQ